MRRSHDETLEELDVSLASFSDRVLAFTADYALFTAGYFWSLALVFPQYPVRANPHGYSWSFLWIGLFVLYQAYFSAGGRRTLGKHLLGLRVISLDNEPLSFPEAFLRSVGYLLSSVLSLGFLWPLVSPVRQGWHDMLVGSVVAEGRHKAQWKRPWLSAAAAACMALFAGVWTWEFILAERYYAIMTVARSHVGLKEIALLQEHYRGRHGRYAPDLVSLAGVSIAPRSFLEDMASLFELDSVQIKATRKGYSVLAHARDLQRTPVRFAGP